MFNDRYSYHRTLRRAISAFMSMFDGITIKRYDGEGAVLQTIPVPISYGPKQKFLERNQEAPTLDTGRASFENKFPHLGVEISGLVYDASRKLQILKPVRSVITPANTISSTFVSTPYNLQISITSWTKNQDDGLQVIEQILPYFNPDFSVNVVDVPELGINQDIMIVLKDIRFTDDYTGNFEQRVAVLWEMDFEMKINLYGFVNSAGVIRESIVRIYSDFNPDAEGVLIDVTPT